jgi:hypothetical protein
VRVRIYPAQADEPGGQLAAAEPMKPVPGMAAAPEAPWLDGRTLGMGRKKGAR